MSIVNEQLPDETAAYDKSVTRAAHLPGEPGVWVLIGGDLLIFSLFFLSFMAYRNASPTIYSSAQSQLNLKLGVLNTILLLTSSWFVATAVQAARRTSPHRAAIFFTLAFLCGLCFVGIKGIEYHERLAAGASIAGNEFFMFYFMLTGVHLLHVLIGLGVLLWLRQKTSGRAPLTAQKMVLIESGATFWHLVDVLWIILFALLYLVR
jgi:nitric oxide reductase NorE protein